MVYVYSRHIRTGKEEFINTYDNWADAIDKVRQCYNTDVKVWAKSEYYYFAKER